MSIQYFCYDVETSGMKSFDLDFKTLMQCLPTDRNCSVHTNVKRHCWDDAKDFIIQVNKGKVSDKKIFEEINDYLRKNNARSFFFEGIVSRGNGKYELMWSS